MKLTEQQFLDGLTADQTAYFNSRLISIRDEFQASYAASVASVADAKDQLVVNAMESLQTEQAAHQATKVQIVTLTAEVERLTALIPPPVADYMITPAVFVERLEAASPGVIDRLWSSETKEAGRLAVTLFTWSERIDCRPGGRLEGYLNLIVQMGFMAADSVAKVWVA